LIYKEVARDQAQRPTGNPLKKEKVPTPGPVNGSSGVIN